MEALNSILTLFALLCTVAVIGVGIVVAVLVMSVEE
jgi:hypothetical protein